MPGFPVPSKTTRVTLAAPVCGSCPRGNHAVSIVSETPATVISPDRVTCLMSPPRSRQITGPRRPADRLEDAAGQLSAHALPQAAAGDALIAPASKIEGDLPSFTPFVFLGRRGIRQALTLAGEGRHHGAVEQEAGAPDVPF